MLPACPAGAQPAVTRFTVEPGQKLVPTFPKYAGSKNPSGFPRFSVSGPAVTPSGLSNRLLNPLISTVVLASTVNGTPVVRLVIDETFHPPRTCSTTPCALPSNAWPLPTGISHTKEFRNRWR